VKYIAGFNQPGYLPESEPEEFDTFDEAKDYLVNEMERALDDSDEESSDDLESDIEEVQEQTAEFSFLASDGYAYWVTCES